ncbi:tyrosine-type recombinase/integrase [Bradyrhizobium sp. 613_E4_N2_2]|uniref:tyrosine-type recombinase/integrase n=1 Tax=Bradyrhizobium sp. 613_E4_N2_2 TaxID=3240371 RepID=UPI003F8C7D37
MPSHEPASDLLPAASDVLPKSAQVIRLPRSERATKPGAPTRITKATIGKLTCPLGQKEAFYWDGEISGLGLRVYPSGRKTWVLQYRDAGGRTRRHPIGQASAIDPAAARKLASDLVRRVAGGANPSVERRQAREAATVGDIFEAYLVHAEKEQRASSFDQTRRNLRKYAARLHREAVAEIDRAAVSRLHQVLGTDVGRVQANRVLASLSAAWVWALRTGLVGGDNPAAYVPKFSEKPRERVLAPDELRLIWRCTDRGGYYDRIVRTLLLTACRRQEIGAMRWSEIEGAVLVVPAARMKRGRPHEVPLAPLALAQLPERFGDSCVFSTSDDGFEGWSGAKKALDRRIADLEAALPSWGLHDLRRTFSTMAHERALADPHIIEAILAHEGAQSGVAGVYNRAAYREQKRAALNAWAELIGDLVGD